MNTQRVLYLTARELTVHRFRDRRLVESFAFAATPVGMDGFERYLAAEPNDPALLLADVIEEEFRTELIPHVGRLERAQLHARHAQRLFRATPFRAARTLGRLTQGRRDDRVLFSALTHPEHLAPWLERLNDADIPLLAISSVPHVTTTLRNRLGLRASHELLLTEQEDAGLRQTFFHEGELRVSRLAPPLPAHASPHAHAEYVQEEIARTQRYLQSLQLLPFGAPLQATVLGSGEWLAALHRHPGADDTQLHLIELSEVQRRVGSALPPTRYANGLFVHLFAGEGRNHYAQAAHLRQRDVHRLRRGLEASGMLAGVVVTLLASANVLQTVEHRRATATAVADIARQQQLSSREIAETLPAGLSPAQLRDAVESAEQLAAVNMQPQVALSRVGGVLQGYPEFTLHRLQWAASANADFSDLEEGPHTGGDAIAFRRPAELAEAAPGLYHGVIVEGRIAPFDGEYRGALSRFGDLVAAFRQMPDVASVEVVTKPLEVSRRIAGSAGSEAKERQEAPFAVRVVFKL